MKQSMLALLIGYLLDLWWGDPHWLPHPVCWIGRLITYLEKWIRKRFSKTERGEFAGGILLAILVIALPALLAVLLLWGTAKIHPALRLILESWMCYQLLAVKSLKTESMKVCQRLKEQDLPGARKAVSMIVGRDTQNLSEEGIAKAAVETVAENISDGIIAPMFYMALLGAVGGFLYKSINTMDSMIGYKNETYLFFGRAAAKLDDVVNWLPARLSAVLLLVSSGLLSLNWKNAWKIYKRDRKKSSSPNAGQPEAVCAGAMEVQLLGDAWYFGVLHHKKTIGEGGHFVTYQDIVIVNRMLYMASFLGILLFTAGKYLVLR